MGQLTEKLRPGFRPLPPDTVCADPRVLIATWFGVGRLRPAPGTLGTLAALPFGYVIAAAGGMGGLLAAALLLLLIGTPMAGYYGAKSGTVDDQSIVVDEVVGLWIAGLTAGVNPWLWLVAFVLFRLFDVWKPWPASFFDRRSSGGFDVMMDDVVAGVYAMLGVSIGAVATLG